MAAWEQSGFLRNIQKYMQTYSDVEERNCVFCGLETERKCMCCGEYICNRHVDEVGYCLLAQGVCFGDMGCGALCGICCHKQCECKCSEYNLR